jgi:hypothetical protein
VTRDVARKAHLSRVRPTRVHRFCRGGALIAQHVRPGDAFALPAAAEPFDVRGDLCVLRCLGGI